MPLDTIEDYERLGRHLTSIDDVVSAFCTRRQFTLQTISGRYPNRKLFRQEGNIWRSIQITMDDMPTGERYDQFFPEIPYTIYGIAYIDDVPTHARWRAPATTVQAVPFFNLRPFLVSQFDFFADYVESFNEETIRAFNLMSPIRT